MRILITGSRGLVGRAVVEHCRARGDLVLAYDHAAVDVADRDCVMRVIERDRPNTVINCAAWTDVDGCEVDHKRAKAVNATGPENLAWASRRTGAGLVTISTDYVFDGAKDGFYTQRDDPNPQSVYGRSKLEGERLAQLAYARTVVVRTGFVFGTGGKNFLSTVVDHVRRGEQVSAISDAFGTPTYAPHLAARMRELAELDLPGIFHVVNSGEGVSYHEFAELALRLARCEEAKVRPVAMASLDRPAPRPRNSRLKCLLSEAVGLQPLPLLKHALAEFVSSCAPESSERAH